MTNRDRLFADEAALPQQADICGAAVDLINSETSPVTGLSVATILIDAGKSSQSHYHRVMEEIYYFVSGRGRVTVGDESFDVWPGVAVSIPVGKFHQVTNTSAEQLKFISADSPSFDASDIYFS